MPRRVGLEDFRRRHWLSGESARKKLASDNGWMAGLLEAFEQAAMPVQLGLCTAAYPGGSISATDFTALKSALLESLDTALQTQGAFDVVVLLLHGALSAAGQTDPESDLLQAVRRRIGPRPLVGVALDFHCNVGEGLVAAADVVVAGRCYPVTDIAARGARLASLLLHRLGQGAADWPAERRQALRTRHVRLPLVAPVSSTQTLVGPFAGLASRARALEIEIGLDDLAIVGGFPFADHDRACVSVLATGQPAACRQAVRELARLTWRRRAELQSTLPGPSVLGQWLREPGHGTLVVADAGDNPGVGGLGQDGTLLAEVLRSRSRFAAGIHVDPRTVQLAQDAGVGGEIALNLRRAGPGPSDLSLLGIWNARVERLGPMVYRNAGPVMPGVTLDGGAGAVLFIQSGSGAVGHVLVASERIQGYDTQAFLSQQVALSGLDVVLIKSSAHFRLDYAAHATRTPEPAMRMADGGGWSSADLHSRLGGLPATDGNSGRSRPVLPLDALDEESWQALIDREPGMRLPVEALA